MRRPTGEAAFLSTAAEWLRYRQLMVLREPPLDVPGAKFNPLLNQIGQLDCEKEMRLILAEMRTNK